MSGKRKDGGVGSTLVLAGTLPYFRCSTSVAPPFATRIHRSPYLILRELGSSPPDPGR